MMPIITLRKTEEKFDIFALKMGFLSNFNVM